MGLWGLCVYKKASRLINFQTDKEVREIVTLIETVLNSRKYKIKERLEGKEKTYAEEPEKRYLFLIRIQ